MTYLDICLVGSQSGTIRDLFLYVLLSLLFFTAGSGSKNVRRGCEKQFSEALVGLHRKIRARKDEEQ